MDFQRSATFTPVISETVSYSEMKVALAHMDDVFIGVPDILFDVYVVHRKADIERQTAPMNTDAGPHIERLRHRLFAFDGRDEETAEASKHFQSFHRLGRHRELRRGVNAGEPRPSESEIRVENQVLDIDSRIEPEKVFGEIKTVPIGQFHVLVQDVIVCYRPCGKNRTPEIRVSDEGLAARRGKPPEFEREPLSPDHGADGATESVRGVRVEIVGEDVCACERALSVPDPVFRAENPRVLWSDLHFHVPKPGKEPIPFDLKVFEPRKALVLLIPSC